MAIFEKKFKIGFQVDGGTTQYKYIKSLNVTDYYAGYYKWKLDSDGANESKIITNSIKLCDIVDNQTHNIAIYVGGCAGQFTLDTTYVSGGVYWADTFYITWTDNKHLNDSGYSQNFSTDPTIWEVYPWVEDWAYSGACVVQGLDFQLRICIIFDENTNKFILCFLSRQLSDAHQDTRGNWYAWNRSFYTYPNEVDIRQYDVATIEYPDLDPDEPVNPDNEGGDGSGDGSSDAVDFPDGIDVSNLIADAHLFNVYHVVTANLQLLNSLMWSNNWFDNLQKGFNSPMECIAGLHILPFSVSGTSAHITVGGIDTNISSEHITNYRKVIDIGSLKIEEYWGNFLDYDNTTVKIYLPFVGFQMLETKKVMGATLTIRYVVDVITGDFQCFLKRSKDGKVHVLYTFSGNMAMSLPLSQSTNTSIMNSVLGLTSGAMMSAVTGNPMPIVGSAISTVGGAMAQSASSEQRSIVHNGSYGGSKGYMGEMTPYVIIERSKQQVPSNYNQFVGVPSYFKATLNTCSGFTKVHEIHLNCSASADERAEIERMLKEGVIL